MATIALLGSFPDLGTDLCSLGHEVLEFHTQREFEEGLAQTSADLYILSIWIPIEQPGPPFEGSVYEVAGQISQLRPSAKILISTAMASMLFGSEDVFRYCDDVVSWPLTGAMVEEWLATH